MYLEDEKTHFVNTRLCITEAKRRTQTMKARTEKQQ
jgi:hypothetical protein